MNLCLFRPHPLAWAVLLASLSAPALAEPTNRTAEEAPAVETLAPVVIEARELEDASYRKNISSVHADRATIENYKGTSVADLLKGLNGVYTGEARNSGALNPNIRGVQGIGRVPVLVDGTEQATSVWLGSHGGMSSRAYIDPNLVGGITAEKGPSFDQPSGIGGALRIRTLEPQDILAPGRRSGLELKVETATGTVSPPPSVDRYIGRDYRDIPGTTASGSAPNDLFLTIPYGGDSTAAPRKRSDENGVNLDDYAWRLAAAAERDYFDVLAAYSYRQTGNYFAGKKGASDYEKMDWLDNKFYALGSYSDDDSGLSDYMAKVFRPGREVLNTHNQTESLLLKGNVYLSDSQTLSLNFMQTEQRYGENPADMSTYIMMGDYQDGVLAVAPDSTLDQKTIKLGYHWKPANYSWIDLDVGLWTTQSEALRNDNGAGRLSVGENQQDIAYNNHVRCNVWPDLYPEGHQEWLSMYKNDYCANAEANGLISDQKDPTIDGTVINRSWQSTRHDRYGLNLSNRFQIRPDLSLSFAANLQREDLSERTGMEGVETIDIYGAETRKYMGARSGEREEYGASVHMDWFVTDTLQLEAGVKYSRYSSFDEGLAKRRKNKEWGSVREITHLEHSYALYLNEQQAEQLGRYEARRAEIDGAWRAKALTDEQKAFAREANAWLENVTSGYVARTADEKSEYNDRVFYGLSGYDKYHKPLVINGATYLGGAGGQGLINVRIPTPGMDLDGYAARNPFTNGTFDIHEKVVDEQGVVHSRYLPPGRYDNTTGEPLAWDADPLDPNLVRVEGKSGYPHNRVYEWNEGREPSFTKPKKRRDDAWAPMLGLTWYPTPHNRFYVRYLEYVRFPSVFEDFQSSFSQLGSRENYRLEAERTHNVELGYVQDLTPWFPDFRALDLRVNYYRNRIENYIDRSDFGAMVMQFDEKRLEGIEVLASLDAGSYFGNLAGSYRLTNELCDNDYAVALDPFHGDKFDRCVTAGFPQTQSRTSLQPEFSLNLDGGVRLLNNRLELGLRGVYHSEAENDDEKAWIKKGYTGLNALNQPYNWKPIWVWDAYANYQVTPAISLTSGINNLTDQYYLDPMARTTMPAPGRNVKLGITARF